MELALRKATRDDLRLLGEIRARTILAQPETFWNKQELQIAADAWATMDVQNDFDNHEIYIYLHNGVEAGFVSWKGAYLAYLFTLPEIQSSGVGSALLKFAESAIRPTHNYIWLIAHPYSEKFYEKHGFKKQPETEIPFGTTRLHKFLKTF